MLFAQSMFTSEVALVTGIAAFLVLLAVDLWSAPACGSQEEVSELSTSRTKPSPSRALQNQ